MNDTVDHPLFRVSEDDHRDAVGHGGSVAADGAAMRCGNSSYPCRSSRSGCDEILTVSWRSAFCAGSTGLRPVDPSQNEAPKQMCGGSGCVTTRFTAHSICRD